MVYGYIRMEEPDEIEIALLRRDISRYCTDRGLLLGSTFVDRDVRGHEIARTGFTALLDVLTFPDSYGVVVPTVDHLSTNDGIRKVLTTRIVGVGRKLFVIYPDASDTADAS
ncbi:recombinase family protein [Umezawaea sp.]|uniref:recombinase family protein n=1 Tax=Umezawaea sp. TaxID=1955258 RepID=UPI002ED42CA7